MAEDCTKTTAEWVQITKPKRLDNRIVLVGSWVVDCEEGKYGKCCGRVVGLNGRDSSLDVEWADGVRESILRDNARLVPGVGSTWTQDGNKYMLKGYTDEGTQLNYLGGPDALTPRRSSRRTRASQKTRRPKVKKKASSQAKTKKKGCISGQDKKKGCISGHAKNNGDISGHANTKGGISGHAKKQVDKKKQAQIKQHEC